MPKKIGGSQQNNKENYKESWITNRFKTKFIAFYTGLVHEIINLSYVGRHDTDKPSVQF